MSFLANNKNGLISEINVTPFVDVMLVLLIIFMVTAPMMIQGEKVDLPVADSQNISNESIDWVISVTENKEIYFNDEKVELGYLKKVLEGKLLSESKKPEVFIKGDKNVPYGTVISVMSEIKSAGIENVSMITIPSESSGS